MLACPKEMLGIEDAQGRLGVSRGIWRVLACPKEMLGIETNGEWQSKEKLANRGKWQLKWVCVLLYSVSKKSLPSFADNFSQMVANF